MKDLKMLKKTNCRSISGYGLRKLQPKNIGLYIEFFMREKISMITKASSCVQFRCNFRNLRNHLVNTYI